MIFAAIFGENATQEAETIEQYRDIAGLVLPCQYLFLYIFGRLASTVCKWDKN